MGIHIICCTPAANACELPTKLSHLAMPRRAIHCEHNQRAQLRLVMLTTPCLAASLNPPWRTCVSPLRHAAMDAHMLLVNAHASMPLAWSALHNSMHSSTIRNTRCNNNLPILTLLAALAVLAAHAVTQSRTQSRSQSRTQSPHC